MNIDLIKIYLDGDTGGGVEYIFPYELEEKNITITSNGNTTISTDEGFDGISSAIITTNVQGGDGLDFAVIGYDNTDNTNANNITNDAIAYSKTLYDAWNPNNTSTEYKYMNDTKLIYAPAIDLSRVLNMSFMFYGCGNLKFIPNFITSNATTVDNMFGSCFKLTSIPELDFGKVTNISGFFAIYSFTPNTSLTDLGGFKNLKIDWSDNSGLAMCPNLTYQSVMNVIKGLYDFRGNGDTTTTRTIKFNANSVALLSNEDKAIATNKGWIIAQ